MTRVPAWRDSRTGSRPSPDAVHKFGKEKAFGEGDSQANFSDLYHVDLDDLLSFAQTYNYRVDEAYLDGLRVATTQ